MRFYHFFAFLLLVTPTAPLHAQTRVTVTASPVPSVQEIVQRAVANDALRRQHRLPLKCDQIITTERLDPSGAVIKSKTVRVPYREGRETAYAADLDAPAGGSHQDGDTAKAEHRMAVMNLRQLVPRFRYTLAGVATVRGRACYVVEYSPDGSQAAKSREEKVINNLHGQYWVDKGTYEILQGEGSLASPVSMGVVGSVTQMDFRFHTQTLPQGEAGPADFSVDLIVKAPLYFYHQRQVSRLENWRAR